MESKYHLISRFSHYNDKHQSTHTHGVHASEVSSREKLIICQMLCRVWQFLPLDPLSPHCQGWSQNIHIPKQMGTLVTSHMSLTHWISGHIYVSK